jgi:hypothetical protein
MSQDWFGWSAHSEKLDDLSLLGWQLQYGRVIQAGEPLFYGIDERRFRNIDE